MLKKIVLFAAIFLFIECFVFSENIVENENSEDSAKSELYENSFFGNSIFSFDLGYLREGLKNNGWGLGLSYERNIFNYFAMKGSFSHMTFSSKSIDSRITTVGIKLEALAYLFGSGLDKLYIGFGGGTDFLMYIDKKDENEKDTVITIYPELGWKQNIFNFMMVDIFCGYRILMNKPSDLSWQADLVENGFEYGLRLKFNLGKIWNLLRKK